MNKIFAVAMLMTVTSGALATAEEVKAPNAMAVCGFKWREHKKVTPEAKGRDAWNTFRRETCGMTGGKKTGDDAIKAYLDAHPGK